MFLGNLGSLPYFLPELAVTATILLLVVLHVVTKRKTSSAPGFLALLGVGAAILLSGVSAPGAGMSIFEGMAAYDGFAVFFKVLTAFATLVVILMSMDSDELAGRTKAEYFIFLLSTLLGMFLLSSATDIVMLYLSLELVSIPSYMLAGYLKGKERSTEAAMKYVVYGATASGVMIYGFSLLFGLTGSTQIAEIGRTLATGKAALPTLLAAVMVAVGFGYKIAAVPFHMWSPDVYEGAPTPATAFFSVGPKAAGFAVLVRFYYTVFAGPDAAEGTWRITSTMDWPLLFAGLSAVTMTVGNLVAVKQNNVKRLLAYSSIAHLGFCLLGVLSRTSQGLAGGTLQLVNHGLTTGALFLMVGFLYERSHKRGLADFGDLASRAPYLAFFFGLSTLSSIGLPGLNGFVGEFMALSGALAALPILAFAGVLGVTLAAAYALPAFQAVFWAPAGPGSVSDKVTDLDARERAVLWTLSALMLWIGLAPRPWLAYFEPALRGLVR